MRDKEYQTEKKKNANDIEFNPEIGHTVQMKKMSSV